MSRLTTSHIHITNITKTITLSVLMWTVCSGCATSLTSMTDARAYAPGEAQISASLQGTLSTHIVSGVADSIQSFDEEFGTNRDDMIDEESFRTWADSILKVMLFAPSFGPEFMVRLGVTDRVLGGLDVGFKTDLNILKGDVKLQLWGSEDGVHALSLSAGYAHHLNVVSQSIVEKIALTTFARNDIDLRLLYGIEPNDFVKFTFVPRMIISRINASHALESEVLNRLPAEIRQFDPNQFFKDEVMLYSGATVTGMLGYTYAYIALDLGVFWLHFNPTVFGQERSYSGTAISLALGLSGHLAFF